MSSRLIVVAGNITSGKTTLVTRLSASLGWRAEFESADDNPYLEDFYRDMKLWSLPLQFYFLGHRAEQHHRAIMGDRSVVLDRSIYENAQVFATMLHESAYISRRDFETYRRLYNAIASQLAAPDLIIYLHAPVDVLLARINKRGRAFERYISKRYLTELGNRYERWVTTLDLCPVLKVDSERSDFADKVQLDALVAEINRVVLASAANLSPAIVPNR